MWEYDSHRFSGDDFREPTCTSANLADFLLADAGNPALLFDTILRCSTCLSGDKAEEALIGISE